jgi:hypothetical protein
VNYNEQQHQDFEKITIELKNKMVVLKVLPFDTDVNVNDILRIDYSNILGECLTFNVIFNRIANLKAEMQDLVNKSKFQLDIFTAELQEEYRKKLTSYGDADAKGKTKINKPTKDEVENAVLIDKRFQVKKNNHFELTKNLEYLESLYWSAQNKANLLKSMSDKLRPEEFSGELLQDTINGVLIKATEKLIK